MWQRIQTLYLFLSTALMASLFFCDKAEGIPFIKYVPYLILLIIIVLLDFLALTTYKHRIFQMRTAVLAAIITIALQAWLVIDFFATYQDVMFCVPAVFPIVSVILNFLAAMNIMADELMVRSASRLRSAKRNKKK